MRKFKFCKPPIYAINAEGFELFPNSSRAAVACLRTSAITSTSANRLIDALVLGSLSVERIIVYYERLLAGAARRRPLVIVSTPPIHLIHRKKADREMAKLWTGVLPAATTQFRGDQSVDIEATLRHLDTMIEAGVHGMIMLGTVGENCSLLFEEKIDLLKAAVQHIAGRIPVLTGVAEYTTSLACKYSQAAQDVGVDGLMLLPAMVYKSDPRETIQHFRTVAGAVDLPIMCYNNPVSYGVDITPEMFAEMADEPQFVAIKESSEDTRRITDLRNRCGDRYTVLCGVDDIVLESLALGAEGWVSGLVNAFPAENRLLWDLAAAGRYGEALEVYRWYMPLLHLDTHPKLVQYIKLAVAEVGLGSEAVRPPRLPLIEAERSRILSIIRQAIANRPTGVTAQITAS